MLLKAFFLTFNIVILQYINDRIKLYETIKN